MTTRLFVATWPDAATRDALAATLHEVRTAAPDVRWQPPERWHITLAFLGEADPDRAVRRIAAHVNANLPEPEPIRLAHSGTFGPVIWVGVEHGPWLADVADGLQRTLRVADRRFRAHVTVGRVRGPGGPARAREVGALLSPRIVPAWTPEEVTLVESTIGPAPQYRILYQWPLGSPRRAAGAAPATIDTTPCTMSDSAPAQILEES